MKKKHQGLISVSMISVAIGAAAAFYFSGYWRTDDFGVPDTTASFATATTPGQNLYDELRKVNRNLDLIAQPVVADAADVDLVLFGHKKPKKADPEISADIQAAPAPIAYTLSFVFSSGNKKICILDGAFYAEGSELPDGGRILTIKPDRVLIQKDLLQEWISAKSKPENISQLSLIDTTPNTIREGR